jgi:hypothetical protein
MVDVLLLLLLLRWMRSSLRNSRTHLRQCAWLEYSRERGAVHRTTSTTTTAGHTTTLFSIHYTQLVLSPLAEK